MQTDQSRQCFVGHQNQEFFDTQGIKRVSVISGILKTDLLRQFSGLMIKDAESLLYGAYTELYVGWSEETGADKSIHTLCLWKGTIRIL